MNWEGIDEQLGPELVGTLEGTTALVTTDLPAAGVQECVPGPARLLEHHCGSNGLDTPLDTDCADGAQCCGGGGRQCSAQAATQLWRSQRE